MTILIILGMVILFAILFTGAVVIIYKIDLSNLPEPYGTALIFITGFITLPFAIVFPICLGIYLITGNWF